MRIRVIDGRCNGHGRCGTVASEVYSLDDDGYLRMPEFVVSPGQEAIAQRGARACPERAIEVLDNADH